MVAIALPFSLLSFLFLYLSSNPLFLLSPSFISFPFLHSLLFPSVPPSFTSCCTLFFPLLSLLNFSLPLNQTLPIDFSFPFLHPLLYTSLPLSCTPSYIPFFFPLLQPLLIAFSFPSFTIWYAILFPPSSNPFLGPTLSFTATLCSFGLITNNC